LTSRRHWKVSIESRSGGEGIIPRGVAQQLFLELWDRPEGLEGRVHVASVAEVLQTGGCSSLELGSLGLIHILEELDLLLGLLDDICVVARGRAHHHDGLVGLEAQLGHVGVILELAALDDDLLTLGLDAGDGEELVLESLAVGRRVNLDFVLLALVLHHDYSMWG
jgi:hypothetical protein